MTEERMALIELVEKQADGDLVREMLAFAAELNRPGFTGEFFVQNLRGFFKGIHVRIEDLLCFLRRDIADGAV
ncbi:hypothetical protein GTH22_21515 [Oceanicola sp. 502str15]|nr:hypothetical protein [Oceanicola sp. 502str15]